MDRIRQERIGGVARRQHGLITTKQLASLGLTAAAIRGRAWLRRVHRGVYQVGPVEAPRAREMAAALACGPRAVLSHRSAAAVWGLLEAPDTAPVDVTVTGGQPRSRRGIRVHRAALDRKERTRLDGIPVTIVTRTLVDLAAVLGGRELEQAAAIAERRGLVSAARLASLPDRYRGHRGAALLRAVILSAEGPRLSRSEAESRVRDLIHDGGLPQPRMNVLVHGLEVDFYWPDHLIVVEVDGYRFHDRRSRFESDRDRTSLLAAHGIQVVPLTWRQIVEKPVATAVRLDRILRIAEQRNAAARGGDPGG